MDEGEDVLVQKLLTERDALKIQVEEKKRFIRRNTYNKKIVELITEKINLKKELDSWDVIINQLQLHTETKVNSTPSPTLPNTTTSHFNYRICKDCGEELTTEWGKRCYDCA